MKDSQNKTPQLRRQGSFGSLLDPSTFFRSSPFHLLTRMQEDMERLIGQMFNSPSQPSTTSMGQSQLWSPSVDVSQTEKEWMIEADLPGVKEEDIDLHVHEGMLSIRAQVREDSSTSSNSQKTEGRQEQQSGDQKKERQYYHRERRFGYFERVIPLPQEVDEETIHAEFHDGVLRIVVPKSTSPQQGKKIPLNKKEGSQQSKRPITDESGKESPHVSH